MRATSFFYGHIDVVVAFRFYVLINYGWVIYIQEYLRVIYGIAFFLVLYLSWCVFLLLVFPFLFGTYYTVTQIVRGRPCFPVHVSCLFMLFSGMIFCAALCDDGHEDMPVFSRFNTLYAGAWAWDGASGR